jgi:hypothetical protein
MATVYPFPMALYNPFMLWRQFILSLWIIIIHSWYGNSLSFPYSSFLSCYGDSLSFPYSPLSYLTFLHHSLRFKSLFIISLFLVSFSMFFIDHSFFIIPLWHLSFLMLFIILLCLLIVSLSLFMSYVLYVS